MPITGKFGKLAPKANPKTLLLSKYLLAEAPLPATPPKVYWEYLLKVPWQMLGNDQFGDCTCAGPAHEIMNRTIHRPALITPTDADVLAMYAAICPGFDPATDANDNGAAITDALAYLQSTGLAGEKISGWAAIDQTSLDHVKLGVYLFGSVNVGVQIPNSAMQQTQDGKPWDVVADDGGIDGGHCIPVLGYGAEGCTCVTWGQLQQMSWEWFAKYCDEAYVELATNWITAKGAQAPNHLDIAALTADLKAIAA